MTNRAFLSLITCLFACLVLLTACVPSSGTPWSKPNSTIPAPVRQSSTQIDARPMESPQGSAFNNLPAVNVAILLPLTGAKSSLGQGMLQAAQLSLFDMGYSNFNLMPRDTKGTAAGASAAATSAIQDGAQIILGPLFADSVRAVKTVARARNINVIAFSTDWSLADSSTFVMGFMPFTQVDRITQYATDRGYKNFAVVAPRDEYGDMVTSRFEKQVRGLGGNISNSIRFTPGDPAVINQIATLKPASGTPAFNAVFMPVGGSQTETVSSALSYNRLMPAQIKRIGTGLWDDPRIAQQPNMQGAWFAGPSPTARKRFEQQYRNTYGQKPIRLATLAYDATSLAAILARNGFTAGKEGPDFSYAALTNPNGFAGTDGIFRFNRNGLVERGLAVLEIRNGGFVEVAPAPKQF